jgi:hypothetical protein
VIGKIPADLVHPQPVADGRDARNLHLTRRQLDQEQHHEPLQPTFGPPHVDRPVFSTLYRVPLQWTSAARTTSYSALNDLSPRRYFGGPVDKVE